LGSVIQHIMDKYAGRGRDEEATGACYGCENASSALPLWKTSVFQFAYFHYNGRACDSTFQGQESTQNISSLKSLRHTRSWTINTKEKRISTAYFIYLRPNFTSSSSKHWWFPFTAAPWSGVPLNPEPWDKSAPACSRRASFETEPWQAARWTGC
jgi:hypothetical protein